MILKLKRTPGIYLVGFMGCGKTTVGRMLSSHLGWHFVDIDHDIEAGEGTTIADIFDLRGEVEFRRLETEALRRRVLRIATGRPMVVALGGGAFAQPQNYELVSQNGVSIWLDLPLEIIRQRVQAAHHRPLARDRKKFENLYAVRREAYARADYRIEVPVDDSNYALEQVLKLGLV